MPALKVNTFAFYLALGITIAGVHPSIQAPESQPSQQQSTHLQLSQSEVPDLKAKAEEGDASAQFALGKAYESGTGVPSNDELAVKWYRKSAEQGNAAAEDELGVMYRLGQGVNRDKEEAVRWYHKAAKHGNPQAMFNLGVCYYNGDGVSSDLTVAYAWFLLAREAGNAAAEDAVKRSAEEGGRMGTPDAFEQVAAMYEKGDDVLQNYTEAAKWYRKAADSSPQAAFKLSAMFIDGRGVPQDYGQAMTFCRSAAKRNYAPGQLCVGYLYQHGLGTHADPKEAAKWYEEASKGGQRQAMMNLAEMYWKGEGLNVDRPEAYYFFCLASRRGAPNAKTEAQTLWKEMSKGEIKRLEKKLRGLRFDPQKVFEFMQEQAAPDAATGSSHR